VHSSFRPRRVLTQYVYTTLLLDHPP
jgi:hypothetical protein